MFEELKIFCKSHVPVTDQELNLIDKYFQQKELRKKEYLLKDNSKCNFLGFIAQGSVRHFHIKDGIEKTCDISFENSWVTDFQSFTHGTPCIMNLQAMEDSSIYVIEKKNLEKLYQDCSKFETFGRHMVEQVVQRATEIAMSLSSDKPEERFQKLINSQSEIFQRIPQKYIANFLGVSPESLSRIRKRVLSRNIH